MPVPILLLVSVLAPLTALYLYIAQLTVHGEVLQVHGAGRCDRQPGVRGAIVSAELSPAHTTFKASFCGREDRGQREC